MKKRRDILILRLEHILNSVISAKEWSNLSKIENKKLKFINLQVLKKHWIHLSTISIMILQKINNLFSKQNVNLRSLWVLVHKELVNRGINNILTFKTQIKTTKH